MFSLLTRFTTPLRYFGLSFFFLLLFTITNSSGQNFYISGGHDFSAALCSEGQVLVWGNNAKNQLGPSPTDVNGQNILTINSKIRQVDAGSGDFGVAVGCQGEVWTWGNAAAQRGNGSNPVSATPSKVVGIGGVNYLSGVKYVNASSDCGYAILANGDLVAWGNNGNGQLGNGSFTPSNIPAYVMTPTGKLTGTTQVEGGDYGGFALVDPDGDGKGTVYSWGDNGSGVLGRGSANPTYALPVLRVDTKQPLDNIISISAGDRHCLAIDANGNLWSWGNNAWKGQSGVGTSDDALYATKVLGGETGDLYLSNVVAIAGGQSFSLAVLATGEVVAFGGMNNPPDWVKSTTPVYLKDAAGKRITGIQSVSDGDFWGFLIAQNGDLFVVGNNEYNQMGIPGGTAANAMYPVPLTLKNCTSADPCPIANLGEDKFKCPSDVLTLYAGSYSDNYTYTWYVNGVKQTPIKGKAGGSFQATEQGTYKVEIASAESNTCSEPCKMAVDSVKINSPTPPAGPTAYYCNGTVYPDYGTLSAKFRWYAGPGTPAEVGVSPNPASFPLSGLTPTGQKDLNGDDIYIAYVEDASGFKGIIGPTESGFSGGGMQPGDGGTTPPKKELSLNFDALSTFILDSLTITYGAYSPKGLLPILINIKNSTGTIIGTSTVLVDLSAAKSGVIYTKKVYIGIKVPAGTGYTIDAAGTDKDVTIQWYSDGPANWFPKTYTISGNNVAGNFQNQFAGASYAGWSSPAFFNWIVTSENYYKCGRIPVKITKLCPPCNKPASFQFTYTAKKLCSTNASTGVTISVGTVTSTDPANPPAAYLYQWYKDNKAFAASDIPQTQKSITTFPGAIYGSGIFRVRVADKDTLTGSGCYLDSMVTISFQEPIKQKSIFVTDTICQGSTSAVVLGTSNTPTGGAAPFSFEWQSAADGITFAKIAGETGETFKPGKPPQTTYFKRIVTGGICGPSASDSALVVVDPKLDSGAIAIVTSPICQNSVPLFSETKPASGGDVSKFIYTWYIDSSFSSTPVWKSIAGSNTSVLTPGPKLTGKGTYHFKRNVQIGKCNSETKAVEVTTIQGMDPGYISASQNLCYNGIPIPLKDSVLAKGGTGSTPTYDYKWQISIDGKNFIDISGATNPNSFDPGKLTSDFYYRRFAKVVGASSKCDSGGTPPVRIRVYKALDPGTIKVSDELCAGAVVNGESLIPASGGSGKFKYQWQKSAASAGPWADVTGTSENFKSDPLKGTTYFRRMAVDASCGDTVTNLYAVRINPVRIPKINSILPTGSICQLDKNVKFTADTLGAGTAGVFTWYLDSQLQPQSNSSDILLSNWTPPTAKIRVTVTPGNDYPCYGPADDTLITLNVTGAQTPSVTLDKINPFCEGSQANFIAGTEPLFNSATDHLVWKVNSNVVASANDQVKFSATTLKNGDVVTVDYTSGSKCALSPNANTSQTVKVYEVPQASILSSTPVVCFGDTVFLKADGSFSSNLPDTTFQWYKDGKIISGAKSSLFRVIASGSYSVSIVNGGICGDTANPTAVEVQKPFVDAGPNKNIPKGDSVMLNASVDTSFSYQLSWSPPDFLVEDLQHPLEPLVKPPHTIYYTITATTTAGCEARDSVKVNVFLPIKIPNAFSPNEDGLNDTWVIDGLETYPDAEIRVFNRWGNVVFHCKGYNDIQQWKGTSSGGSPLASAVYYYVIDPKNENGGGVHTGYVTVVR